VAHWPDVLRAAGFPDPAATLVGCGRAVACLIVAAVAPVDVRTAETPAAETVPTGTKSTLVVAPAQGSSLATKLYEALSASGVNAALVTGSSEFPPTAQD